jgi:hypothetical protein
MELGVPSEYAGKAMVKTLASRIAEVIGGCLPWLMMAQQGSSCFSAARSRARETHKFRPAHRVAAMSEFKHPNRHGVPFCSCFINLSSFLPAPRATVAAASETCRAGSRPTWPGTARKNKSSKEYSHADNSHNFSFVEAKIIAFDEFWQSAAGYRQERSALRGTPRRLNSPLVRSGKLSAECRDYGSAVPASRL